MEGQGRALLTSHGGTALLSRPLCSRSRARPQQTRGFLRQQSTRAVIESPPLPFAADAEHLTRWAPDSWRQLKASQQPNYQDRQRLRDAVDTISRMPPLVFAGECRNLQERLAKCASGDAFLVQGTFVLPEDLIYCMPTWHRRSQKAIKNVLDLLQPDPRSMRPLQLWPFEGSISTWVLFHPMHASYG